MFGGAYIGQFARHGNKTGNGDRLGAPGGVDMGRGGEQGRVEAERFQALAQHLAALAKRGRSHLFKRAAVAGLGLRARHQAHKDELALVTAEKDLRASQQQLESTRKRLEHLVAEMEDLGAQLHEAGAEKDEAQR